MKQKLRLIYHYFRQTIYYIEQNVKTKPHNRENNLMEFGLMGLFFYSILSYGFHLYEYEDFLFILGILWFVFSLGSIPYGIRLTVSLIRLLLKKSFPYYGTDLTSTVVSIFAFFWKIFTSLLTVFAGLVGMLVGLNYFYQTIYQINLLQEFFFAYAKYQSWEQVKEHVINVFKSHGR